MHPVVTRASFLGGLAALTGSLALAHADSASERAFAVHRPALDLSSPQRAMAAFFVAINSFDARSYDAMLTDDATLFFSPF